MIRVALMLAWTVGLAAGQCGPDNATVRPCRDEPGETCASCQFTAVTISCTVKVAGHGCTVGGHVNFGGWVVCS